MTSNEIGDLRLPAEPEYLRGCGSGIDCLSVLVINDEHYPDQHGLCLGDVTGDGDHELVVGTDGGELLVFKGAGSEVWRRGQDLGFITAVGEFIMIDIII